MTLEPLTPTRPGRSTSAFHRRGRRCLHQARSAMRCWASRIKGELRTTRYNEPPERRACFWMSASTNWPIMLSWAPFQRQQWGYHVTASWAPYHIHYQVRDTITPLFAEASFFTRTNDRTRPPAVVTAKKQKQRRVSRSPSERRGSHHLRQPMPAQPTSPEQQTYCSTSFSGLGDTAYLEDDNYNFFKRLVRGGARYVGAHQIPEHCGK